MRKQLILLAAGMCCGLYTFAQVSFGLKAGFSAANVSSKISPPEAGAIVDIPLADYFSFQPGLFYSSKGYKAEVMTTDINGGEVPITVTSHLNYLELPLNVLYKVPMGNGKFFGGFGPYLAYGIGGKVKAKNENTGVAAEVDVKFKNESSTTSNEVYVKPFDAGANITAGYELNMGLLFSANFSLGLLNTSPYQYEKERNYYFGISVGYLLKR
jgi:hypothetical protein